jgi:hypothetical protein
MCLVLEIRHASPNILYDFSSRAVRRIVMGVFSSIQQWRMILAERRASTSPAMVLLGKW